MPDVLGRRALGRRRPAQLGQGGRRRAARRALRLHDERGAQHHVHADRQSLPDPGGLVARSDHHATQRARGHAHSEALHRVRLGRGAVSARRHEEAAAPLLAEGAQGGAAFHLRLDRPLRHHGSLHRRQRRPRPERPLRAAGGGHRALGPAQDHSGHLAPAALQAHQGRGGHRLRDAHRDARDGQGPRRARGAGGRQLAGVRRDGLRQHGGLLLQDVFERGLLLALGGRRLHRGLLAAGRHRHRGLGRAHAHLLHAVLHARAQGGARGLPHHRRLRPRRPESAADALAREQVHLRHVPGLHGPHAHAGRRRGPDGQRGRLLHRAARRRAAERYGPAAQAPAHLREAHREDAGRAAVLGEQVRRRRHLRRRDLRRRGVSSARWTLRPAA
mmetsp:Transcript_6925/g.17313  ORF Transcript_6925/g.17313 Transcript_6925/m.17313 type:complete len:388 (-) Transcript_6925:38-1201(-)